MTPRYWRRATTELAASDAIMAALIASAPAASPRYRADPFQALARSIVGQQISTKAAASLWQRLVQELGEVAPDRVVQLSPESLRAFGLSRQKAAYLSDLAQHFVDGRLVPEVWGDADDQSVIALLTRVKGIGLWTAQMFLMFHLQRPDVLPLGDLGLRRAASLHYNRGRALSDRRLRRIAQPWAPWRSVATWYLWRSLEQDRKG